MEPDPTVAGLTWQVFPGSWSQLPDLTKEQSVFKGESPNLYADAQGFTRYAAAWDGLIDIPADGGYTFHLLDRDGGRLVIDGLQVARLAHPLRRSAARPAAPCVTTAVRSAFAPASTQSMWRACTG